MRTVVAKAAAAEERAEYTVVGKRLARVDGKEKVAGKVKFVDDLHFPGMLYGKILRSPRAHAKIVMIDTTAAQKLDGVKAVISGKDLPSVKYATPREAGDRTPLSTDKVRFVGDAVAAVAAVDEETAEKAVALIKVKYEPLPVVLDPEEAMKPGAPQIHSHVKNNILHEVHWNFGDVEKGFRESDYVFEDRLSTTAQPHMCLETHGCVGLWEPDGRVILWTSSQSPHFRRTDLAKTLGIPLGLVSIKKATIGGAFGSKYELYPDHHLVSLFLSKKTGRPVKMILSREEEFYCTTTRHAAIFELKTGVKKDGTIVARQVRAILDKGAYASQGIFVLGSVAWRFTLPYRVNHVKFDGYLVYTNKASAGAFEGFGSPQVTYAIECQMDIIAEKLGIDPVDLRLKNATRARDIAPGGTQPVSCGLSECIEKVAEAIGWREKKRTKIPGRGLGIACTYFECGARGFVGDTDMSTAFVQVDESGVARIWCGGSDLGTGFDTVMSQIVAEALGLKLENVRITTTDTDITPFDTGIWASRGTMMNGNAVKAAAEDARKTLLAAAAEILYTQTSEVVLRDGYASVRGAGEKKVPLSDVAAYSYFTKATPILGKGFYDPDSHVLDDRGNSTPPGYCPTYLFAAEALEVHVDKETGEFKVLEVAAAHDCGTAINPTLVEGQIEGGVARGLGMATNEGLRYDASGKCINATFTDHKMFTAQDMPMMKPIIADVVDPKGPFGAKGGSQMSLVNAPPALSNAIYDAVRVRIKELPITPEKILEELGAR